MMRILLVENNELDCALFKYATSRINGITVDVCTTIEAARFILRKHDLVVIDANLPDGCGFEFATEVADKKIPYAICSGFVKIQELVAKLPSEPQFVLSKELGVEGLRCTMEHYCNGDRSTKARRNNG